METRNYLANAAGSPPPKPSSPSNGYPQSATPGVNEATTPGPFWFYKVGEELRKVITQAGITPSDDNLGQMLAALQGLGLQDAAESKKGVLEIATAAEAQAFTANKAIDGAKLGAAMQGPNQNIASTGYQKLPGGLIIQWGVTSNINSGSSANVTFPVAFPNTVLSAVCSATGSSVSSAACEMATSSGGATNMIIYNWSSSRNAPARWVAIGY